MNESAITIEAFNKAIANIARAQARATREIGSACLMALYFANVEKDAGAANALVNCLRTSTKQSGIIALLETHGNLAHTKIGKKAGFEWFDAHHDGATWKDTVGELREICAAWETFKPVKKDEDVLDVIESLERLLKKADSAIINKKAVKGAALVSTLHKLVATFNAREMDAILGG